MIPKSLGKKTKMEKTCELCCAVKEWHNFNFLNNSCIKIPHIWGTIHGNRALLSYSFHSRICISTYNEQVCFFFLTLKKHVSINAMQCLKSHKKIWPCIITVLKYKFSLKFQRCSKAIIYITLFSVDLNLTGAVEVLEMLSQWIIIVINCSFRQEQDSSVNKSLLVESIYYLPLDSLCLLA